MRKNQLVLVVTVAVCAFSLPFLIWKFPKSDQKSSKDIELQYAPFKPAEKLETPIAYKETPAIQQMQMSKAPKQPPVKLIVLGYKGGGTSFTNEMMNSHSEVFMIYEPVWYIKDPDIWGAHITDSRVSLKDRTKKQWSARQDIPEPLDFIRDWLDCHVTRRNLEFIMYDAGSKDTSAARKCLKGKGQMEKSCLQKAEEMCRLKGATLTKTVRLSITEAGQLLEADPAIRVLYLARDPRGNRNSHEQRNKSFFDHNKVPGRDLSPPPYSGKALVQSVCANMNEDARNFREIKTKYPDRLIALRYEDIADNPIFFAGKLFRFMNLEFTAKAKAKITAMTSSNEKEKAFQTKRSNSSATSSRWRSQISFKTAQLVQSECKDTFELFNYTPFTSEADMKNPALPFRGLFALGF